MRALTLEEKIMGYDARELDEIMKINVGDTPRNIAHGIVTKHTAPLRKIPDTPSKYRGFHSPTAKSARAEVGSLLRATRGQRGVRNKLSLLRHYYRAAITPHPKGHMPNVAFKGGS